MIKNKKLLKLIEEQKNESHYQSFLENNREYIPLTFMLHHGLHLDLIFTKYPIQESHTTDFMFLTKTSMTWRAVLIEIEAPGSKIFKQGSNEFHSDFIHAKDQILNWRTRLAAKGAGDVFKHHLKTLMNHMDDNDIEFKYILIHGRSSELKNHPSRMKKIRLELGEDVQFLTFDSLLNLDMKGNPSFLAKKVNERFHLVDYNSEPFYGERLLTSAHPSAFYVTKQVKDSFKLLLRTKKIPRFNLLDENRNTKIKTIISELVVKKR